MFRATRRFALVATAAGCSFIHARADEKQERRGVLAAIGNTPLITLEGLSQATGCRIMAKCEHLNPAGSVKDRAALYIIEEAERSGALKPGGTVCEGTGGNTGVALAMVAAAKGYKAIFAIPETISPEKIEVIPCPICPFTDPRHFYHTAASRASSTPNSLFTNQFENLANQRAHIEGTGPEIWQQAEGKVDGFVCSAGTGGTISGVSQFLKSQNPQCLTYIIDPMGGALFDFVHNSTTEASATKNIDPVSLIDEATNRLVAQDVNGFMTRFIPRSAGSSIAEGIGIDRVTSNFRHCVLDGAMQGNDQEIVEMAYYLKDKEGVFVGPSAALNVIGAVNLARRLGPGHTVVTILCDSGDRYRTTLYNKDFLDKKGLQIAPLSNQTPSA